MRQSLLVGSVSGSWKEPVQGKDFLMQILGEFQGCECHRIMNQPLHFVFLQHVVSIVCCHDQEECWLDVLL